MSAAALMLFAWAVELVFGWPDWLYRRVRHPVVWFGSFVSWLEHLLNRPVWHPRVRYIAGMASSIAAIGLAVLIAFSVTELLPKTWWGYAILALIASSLIASRSLHAHVVAVAKPLQAGNVQQARLAVGMIVGRDPEKLDAAGIARAALESLAENASDGVVAPLFWGAIFGLPGLVAYKAINTLDSMVGHRNDRYRNFGGFAARLDDIANLIPARLTGLCICLASFSLAAFTIMLRDADQHRSPNAGWPEAAMAGALGVRLSGPRSYGDQTTQQPWLNPDCSDPDVDDLQRGLVRYRRAMVIVGGLLMLLALGLAI